MGRIPDLQDSRDASPRVGSRRVGESPIAQFLLGSRTAALAWTPVRMYLGWQWISAGLDQLHDTQWMNGTRLSRFWFDALEVAASSSDVAFTPLYRDILHALVEADAAEFCARLITCGELAVGLALILGAFVGIAACIGAFVNMNFLFMGTTGSNPILFVLAIGLILAWRVAGYFGLDMLLLPSVGISFSRPRHSA